jgi:predicted transcriptional regulator
MKLEQKIQAQKLRKQGISINDIAKQLNVSKSSVSTWVKDIILTSEQIKELEKQNPIYNKQLHGSQVKANNARKQRLQYQNEGMLKAKEGNLLHQAGCMLYWAEGAKSKNQCKFVNSDIEMLKLFMSFLRKILNISNDKITFTINCYTTNGLTKSDIENFWFNILDLNSSNLRKGQENNKPRSSTNQIRHNKLIYGIVSISVNSTQLVQHIYGAIQEYANFSNNYMLK